MKKSWGKKCLKKKNSTVLDVNVCCCFFAFVFVAFRKFVALKEKKSYCMPALSIQNGRMSRLTENMGKK